MLRRCLLALAILGVLLSALGLASGALPSLPALLWSLALLAALLLERWRYRAPASAAPVDDGWGATGEKFIDPESGSVTTVFYNQRTGERRYDSDA